eukprot:TRINITY_DN4223_c0_g1_i2.p1 TRINITY_DN4223_c0_g1~~TRINITY_DN4223_c0_g1_i2.p1  ORF type:complete len:172 (-),score=13.84 TRINITY_DN4223_c0_g1_i2:52-567(-)
MSVGDGDFLFSNNIVLPEKDPGFLARPLHIDDFDKGYVELLGQLTDIGTVSRDAWQKRFREWQASRGVYYIAVIEDVKSHRVVAAATLLVERKLVHSVGQVGHIEDVVVDSTYRGKNLGRRIIDQVLYIGQSLGCYKVILDCSENNVQFYEKCNFKRKEYQMARYFPDPKL